MTGDDWKKALGVAGEALAMISPHIALAVKAGTIAVEVYNDFLEARAEILQLAAKDQVTKEEIAALDDSIQARSARIKALLKPKS